MTSPPPRTTGIIRSFRQSAPFLKKPSGNGHLDIAVEIDMFDDWIVSANSARDGEIVDHSAQIG